MQFKDWIFLFALVFPVGSSVVMAGTESKDIQALARQVEILNNEVTRLKQAVESLQAIQPTITSLMPDFSERFHVMHYAGEAEDWALASHELLGLKRLIEIMKQVDPETGAMVNGFLLGNINRIDAAIEHKNIKSFQKSLKQTVENCNSCHVAVGSPSMKVVLDARDALSMRHSHDLGKSDKPGKHTHMHN